MAVGAGAAMAGNMLHDGQHAAGKQAVRRRTPDVRDPRRLAAVSAIADDLMRAGLRRVEHGEAIDGDPHLAQIMRHETRAQKGETRRSLQIRAEAFIGCGARIGSPMRRREPLHAAALLIDENGEAIVAERVTQRFGQRAKLRA